MFFNYNFSSYFHIQAIVDLLFLLEILFPFKIIFKLLLKDLQKSVMNSYPGICIQLHHVFLSLNSILIFSAQFEKNEKVDLSLFDTLLVHLTRPPLQSHAGVDKFVYCYYASFKA